MQRKRTRLAAVVLVVVPALTLGPIASQVWAQAGGSGAGAQTAGQQPSSPSAPGAADQRQSGASTNRATAPPAPPGTQQTTPPSSDRTRVDPNRAATGRDATGRTSGQPRQFDVGGQLRARDNGLMVGTVREDGFFHNAGISEGDRIISINGQKVTSEADFRRLMMARQGRFPVIIMRNDERQEIMVNADDLNAANGLTASSESNESELPVYERMNDPRAALGIWFFSVPEGAHVVHVVPGSPAERAGLKRGDFITQLNGTTGDDWQGVTHHVAEAGPQSTLKLQVTRDGRDMPMEARLGGYFEVFSDPNENSWSNVAAQYQEDANRFNRTGRYWTGRANPTGSDYDQGARMQSGGAQNLERRIRELEREVADLREQLNRGTSTSAPAGRQNTNGQRQNDNGQRTSAPPPPDGQ